MVITPFEELNPDLIGEEINPLSEESTTPSSEIFMDHPSFEETNTFDDVIPMSREGMNPIVTLPEEVIQQRSTKYEFALDGEVSTDEILDFINGGNEDILRENTVFAEQAKAHRANTDLLIETVTGNTGRPVSSAELFAVSSLAENTFEFNPRTVIEKMYGEKIATRASVQLPSDIVREAFNKRPNESNFWIDLAANTIANKEIALKRAEELEAEQQRLEGLAKVEDTVEQFISFFSWAQQGSILDDAGTGIRLPGDTIRHKIQFLYSLAPDEFEVQFNQAVDELAETNIGEALLFTQAVVSFTTQEQNLENIFGIFDLTVLPSLATLGIRKLIRAGASRRARTGVTEAREAVENLQRTGGETPKSATENASEADVVANTAKEAVRATSGRTTRSEDVLERVGDVEQAAYEKVRKDILDVTQLAGTEQRTLNSLFKDMPTLFDPKSVFDGNFKLARESADRIRAGVFKDSGDLINSLNNISTISRVKGESLDEAIVQAREKFNVRYPGANERVLDGGPALFKAEDAPLNLNVDRLEFKIGNKDKELYPNPIQALFEARELLGLRDFTVKAQGNGWYISTIQPIDITVPQALNVRLRTRGETPVSLVNQWIGILRTPEDTLSISQRSDRLTATLGGQELMNSQIEVARRIGMTRGADRDSLLDYITAQRDWQDFKTGEIGRYDSSLGEFEINWERKFGELPNERVTQGYFAFRQLAEYDYVIRNLSVARDKLTLGLEDFIYTIRIRNENTGSLDSFSSPRIEGKEVDSIPWNHPDDVGVLIVNNEGGRRSSNYDYFSSKDEFTFQAKRREKVEDLVENEGYRIIQLSPKGEHTLRTGHGTQVSKLVGSGKIHFMVTNVAESRVLDFKQIPRSTGFHAEYPDGFFISQPIILRRGPSARQVHRYEGDRNIMHFATEREAIKFTERFNIARRLANRERTEALDNYVSRNLPFANGDQFIKWANKHNIDLNIPLAHRANGENLATRHDLSSQFPNFTNAQESSLNLYNTTNLRFAQTRDPVLRTIVTEGTAEAPAYNFRKVELISPIDSLQRSAQGLANNRFLDDMKFNVALDFVQQFGNTLRRGANETTQDLLDNPYKALFEREFDPNFADRRVLEAAKNVRRASKQFLGIKSDTQKVFEHSLGKLSDVLLDSPIRGTSTGSKIVDWAKETNPETFLKRTAFHTILGLGNWIQAAVQAQTIFHTFALAGPRATRLAVAAAYYSRTRMSLDFDPNMTEAFSRRLRRFGWNPQHFIESERGLRETGLIRVGREVAIRDDLSYSLVDGRFGSFLDQAAVFFNETERSIRLTAWHAAYSNWRRANPRAVFNREAIDEVRLESGRLFVDMTRASNRSWQEGFTGPVTQFASYPVSLMEQFLGKRTTAREKLQLYMTYGLVYGFPTGTTALLGLYPWHTEIMQEARRRGIDADPNIIQDILLNGIPQTILESVTGYEFNIGQSYGPHGLLFLRHFIDALNGDARSDAHFVDFLLGPGGAKLRGIIGSTEPFLDKLLSVFNDEIDPITQKPITYDLQVEDFLEPLREIESLDNALQIMYALNVGVWISKSGLEISEVSKTEALIMGLTGLRTQNISNTYWRLGALRDLNKLQRRQEREIRKWINRAIRSAESGDREGALSKMKRARLEFIAGNFRIDQWNDVARRALRNIPLDRAIAYEFQKNFIDPNVLREIEIETESQERRLGR